MEQDLTYKGTVAKTTGSWYIVRNEKGDLINCRIRGNFRTKNLKTTNPIAVGDHVQFKILSEENVGVIFNIEERKNCIIRKSTKLSKQTHILATNIDQALLVVTLAFPRTSTGFIDRFLVNAESFHIPTILIFNKIDLYDDSLEKLHKKLVEIYKDAGYTCIATSAFEGKNIDILKFLMKDKVSLLSGHSGVGKSALISAVDNALQLKVGDVSTWSEKGKHTTTFAEMFHLSFGGDIIDTPGIKEFGMVNIEREEISHFYPEMKKFLYDCRFTNCTHEHEPGCAVKEAVKRGNISEIRYHNYLNILNGREMDIEDWEKE